MNKYRKLCIIKKNKNKMLVKLLYKVFRKCCGRGYVSKFFTASSIFALLGLVGICSFMLSFIITMFYEAGDLGDYGLWIIYSPWIVTLMLAISICVELRNIKIAVNKYRENNSKELPVPWNDAFNMSMVSEGGIGYTFVPLNEDTTSENDL